MPNPEKTEGVDMVAPNRKPPERHWGTFRGRPESTFRQVINLVAKRCVGCGIEFQTHSRNAKRCTECRKALPRSSKEHYRET